MAAVISGVMFGTEFRIASVAVLRLILPSTRVAALVAQLFRIVRATWAVTWGRAKSWEMRVKLPRAAKILCATTGGMPRAINWLALTVLTFSFGWPVVVVGWQAESTVTKSTSLGCSA